MPNRLVQCLKSYLWFYIGETRSVRLVPWIRWLTLPSSVFNSWQKLQFAPSLSPLARRFMCYDQHVKYQKPHGFPLTKNLLWIIMLTSTVHTQDCKTILLQQSCCSNETRILLCDQAALLNGLGNLQKNIKSRQLDLRQDLRRIKLTIRSQ